MEMADISLRQGDNLILVIDTDSYSGNFERQLCGFTTGVYDVDRGHGEAEAEEALADHPDMIAAISSKVTTQRHSEYGDCSNAIRATPGRLNNGCGYCFDADDRIAAMEAKTRAKEHMVEYYADQIAMWERRLREEDFEADRGWTKTACERGLAAAHQSIERAGESQWPAYESVAIFLLSPLTPEELAFVEKRAREYGQRCRKPFEIKAVYQINAKLAVVETRLWEPT